MADTVTLDVIPGEREPSARVREGNPWTPIPSPCMRTASAFTKVTADQMLTLTRRSFSEGGRRG